MSTLSISLSEPLCEFVNEQIVLGGYGTASDYVQTLIQEDQKRKAQEELEALLLDGLDSGEPIESTPEFWQDFRNQVSERRTPEMQTKNPLVALLDEWEAEDATDDPQELARREQEWETLKQNLNANRCATGERLHFPYENRISEGDITSCQK